LLGIPDHSEFGAVPRLESKKSAQFLGEERNRKPGIGARLVSETYLLIESNWKHPDRKFKPSPKLWVPRIRSEWSRDWNSPEVPLERSAVALFELGRPISGKGWDQGLLWFNQIPVASGIVKGGKGSKAIDLICRKAEEQYDFIELKFPRPDNSSGDTPLYAAMEILKYGLIYLYMAQYPDTLTAAEGWPDEKDLPRGAKARELLEATDVDLCVVAPKRFYSPFELGWLGDELATGLEEFVSKNTFPHLRRMTFRFEHLSDQPFELTLGNGFKFDFTRYKVPNSMWSALKLNDKRTAITR